MAAFDLQKKAAELSDNHKRQGRRKKLRSALAMAVALATLYALLLPAFTMAKTPYCGMEEHVHSDACYELTCGLEEGEGHHHGEACFEKQRVLVCGMEEKEGHAHTDGCYVKERQLTCTLEETEGHTHTDQCYETGRSLICGREEAEGHTHGEECRDEEGELICGLEECEGHEHSDDCYEEYKKLVCDKEECEGHQHSDHCYTETEKLVCGLEECEGHAHTDACYEEKEILICELGEAEAHVHTDACYALVCGKEEHTHTAECYVNTQADVENENIWEKTLPEFAGEDAISRFLAIAASQLGYHESLTNYAAEGDLQRGYTRYGQWRGDAYADWDTMFVQFCLHYAGIRPAVLEQGSKGAGLMEAAAAAADSRKLLEAFDGAESFVSGEVLTEFVPAPGDIVFLQDPERETVTAGIVFSADAEKAVMEVIAGNVEDAVRQTRYDLNDSTILGYGILPEEVRALDAGSEGETETEPETTLPVVDPMESSEEETDPEESSEAEPQTTEPAEAVMIFEDRTDKVSVLVEAPAGAFPEGTVMELDPVKAEDVMDAVTDVVSSEILRVEAVDITFWFNGEEIEPALPIRVHMQPMEAAEDAADEPLLVHVDDDGKAEQVIPLDPEEVQQPAEPQTEAAETEEVSEADAQSREAETETQEEAETVPQTTEEIVFETDSFSVYALVYTVDFHWEVDGKEFAFSLPGGSYLDLQSLIEALGIAEKDGEKTAEDGTSYLQKFMEGIGSVTFSDPELMWVGRAAEDTTVGALKEANGLEPQYAKQLTQEQIAEMDDIQVPAGTWAMISLQPFDTEESLTITMTDGQEFIVRVTDAHEIPDSSADTIDVNKSYLICYEVNGQYYLLKNDGSVDGSHTPANFEGLNSTYCWTFNYVFEEKHLEETLTYIYYLIRPIDNKSRTIALNEDGNPLVQQSNNNVAVVPAEGGGFHLIGYNEVKLDFENGSFTANQLPAGNDGIIVHIYEMDQLPTYSYTAESSDEERGTVTITGGTQQTRTEADGTVIHYYEAESTSDKMNAGTITASPANHTNDELHWGDTGFGQNKWTFDHWEQDGIPLDRDQYPASINADSLPIPFNGSKLVAYFKQNPNYVVPDSEKEPSSFEDMTDWLNDLTTNHVPLDESATQKTAEVYDYENRIYRVDIKSRANFRTFNGNVDMAFCMDVSNSMYFPSKLVPTASSNHGNPLPIYQINSETGWWSNKGWLDQSRGWNNPYYLIADQSNTATVFKVYYQDGNWKAQDASRETESEKSFVIGQIFETTWTSSVTDKHYPFNAGDDSNTTYTIYDAGDYGRNRFYYLNQSFSGATSDLTTIKNTLAVAGA